MDKALPASTPEEAQWWRWPLLPFAATIGAILGTLAFMLLQWLLMMFQGWGPNGWYALYILPFMSSCLFGYLFAIITLQFAPKGKIIAAVVMTTLLGALYLLGTIGLWAVSKEGVGTAIQQTIGSIASLGSAIMTIVSEKDNYRS